MDRRLSIAALSLALLRRAVQPTSLHRYESVEPHMGTLVRITLYAPDEQTATAAFRAAFDRIRDLDEILSDYKPDSELNRIATNRRRSRRAGQRRPVHGARASQELADATGGAFDITQGPVIRLWREARKTARVPDAAALREAASRSRLPQASPRP